MLRFAAVPFVVLALLGGSPVYADSSWTLSPSQSGIWSISTNWDSGVPTSSVNAYVANGGTATVDASGGTCRLLTINNSSTLQISGGSLATGISGWTAWSVDGASTLQLNAGTLTANSYGATAYVGNASTGTFVQSDGINQINDSIYVGYNAGASGTYGMSGGTLTANNVEYIGYSGSGSFVQTGGTMGPVRTDGFANNILFLGYDPGATGVYSLSGTGQMNSHVEYIGYSGAGTLTQNGGINNVTYYGGNSYYLYLGYNANSSGTYQLNAGTLSAKQEFVGYNASANALLQQTGGSNSTNYIAIGAGGRMVLSGGTLNLAAAGYGGISNQGAIDCSNSHATLLVGSYNIVDLSQAELTNVSGMTVSLGANSLLTIPNGFNPATAFASFTQDTSSIVHTAGTPLVILAGQVVGGQGFINDLVDCRGTLTSCSTIGAFAGALNLNNGLILSGSGVLNIGYGALTVNDTVSQITGGNLIIGANGYIGRKGVGVITQTGGSYGTNNGGLYLGYNSGDGGTYNLSGGSLYTSTTYVGHSGTGTFVQTGGSATAISSLYIGCNSGSSGTFELDGSGYLHTQGEYVGYNGAGTLTQTGGTNTLSGAGGICVGYNAAGRGTYNLSGGQIAVAYERIGGSGIGVFNQSGGTNYIPYAQGYNNSLYVGQGTGNGTYNLSGGQLSAPTEYIGGTAGGTAVLHQTGGTNTTTDIVIGSGGTYDLNAGALVLKSLSAGSGTIVFSFGGGTMKAAGTFSTTVPMTLTGIGGNASVDTAGYVVTLSGQLSGPGGLSKVGAGTLILSAANDYTGNTAVYAGILSLAQPDLYDGSSVSVAPNAVLNLTYSGSDIVRSLTLGGIQEPPGIYNSTDSGGYITGTGSLQVVVPEPSTLILLGGSAIGLFVYIWRWRRRSR
jgi:autotransporter-associated beta strand protein